MPTLKDILPGKTPAESVDIQQLVLTLSGRQNTPVGITVNDPIAYALALKNTDPSARGVLCYAADGTTVLFSVDATGVRVSSAGAAAVPPLTDVGPGGAQVAVGNHTHGSGGYSGTGAVTLEALYAGATVSTAVNYIVATAVLYVFCTSGVTITLPAASTNRPITIVSEAGTQTVNSQGGTVNGGSTNQSTGAVMNGIVSPGDSITFKSDAINWFAV